jgi:hypothetical protein
MGRRKRQGGSFAVENAEKLFQQSVLDGTPDYQLVALAIGARPSAPPSWAVWECIELRQRHERIPARGNDGDMSDILDALVRFFDHAGRNGERLKTHGHDGSERYSPPSLRSAIIQVLKDRGLRAERVSSANDDWFRDIREAWEWEQAHELAPSSFMELEEGDVDEADKRLKTTSRIHRVLMQEVAAEVGDPQDVHVWAWIAKRMIDHEMAGRAATDRT